MNSIRERRRGDVSNLHEEAIAEIRPVEAGRKLALASPSGILALW